MVMKDLKEKTFTEGVENAQLETNTEKGFNPNKA
jgi:hypothetical protein